MQLCLECYLTCFCVFEENCRRMHLQEQAALDNQLLQLFTLRLMTRCCFSEALSSHPAWNLFFLEQACLRSFLLFLVENGKIWHLYVIELTSPWGFAF